MSAEPLRRTLRVAEIFGPTVQGEGRLIGVPTWFVRFGGCDYRCSWCDSLHAVLPKHRGLWAPMTPAGIIDELSRLGVPRETSRTVPRATHGPWITLSGGNPALFDLSGLVRDMQAEGWRVALETQGSRAQSWFETLDHLCLSPKPPSSGNVTPFADVRASLRFAPTETILKVVIFDDGDLAYAKAVFSAFPSVPAYLSVGNPVVDAREPAETTRERQLAAYAALAERVARRLPHVTVLPQLHVLAWGNAPAR